MGLTIVTLILIALSLPADSFPQSPWFHGPHRLTSGNNDRNPSFDNNVYPVESLLRYENELLIFERYLSNSSNICIATINSGGAIGDPVYLTNDSYQNVNPSVSYFGKPTQLLTKTIKKAMAVWESDRFGRPCILGKIFDMNSGWSQIVIIDSSIAGSSDPKVSCYDSATFCITYSKGNDICYAMYNTNSAILSYQTNLTSTDSLVCRNSCIVRNGSNITVTYERVISPNQVAIYFRNGYADSMPTSFQLHDTVAFLGINVNEGFGIFGSIRCAVFSSSRNGTSAVFAGTYSNQSNQQFAVIPQDAFDNSDYLGTDLIITANQEIRNFVYAFVQKKSMTQILFYFGLDSMTINASSNSQYNTKLTLNSSMYVPNFPCQRFWFVFNKDSSDSNHPSSIYGYYFDNCLTGTGIINSEPSKSYMLKQNYPNPFNPSTSISFQLPDAGNVSLKLFDVLGKEVMTLVNEYRAPGSYEVRLDASNLAGGMYFYKLVSGSFSETKKMILVK